MTVLVSATGCGGKKEAVVGKYGLYEKEGADAEIELKDDGIFVVNVVGTGKYVGRDLHYGGTYTVEGQTLLLSIPGVVEPHKGPPGAPFGQEIKAEMKIEGEYLVDKYGDSWKKK